MANWCCNMVTFNGPQENLQNLLKILEDMTKRCNDTGFGVIPILQEGPDDGYFFNITVEDENVNEEVDEPFIIIRYDTKWSPNQENLKWIAVKFGVDFVQEYEEGGNKMYGQYRLMHLDDPEGEPILQHRFLSDEEYIQCMFLESDDGKTRHNRDEVTDEKWDELLEEDGWTEMEDYEKLEDTLTDEEWCYV
jgi:hypothetical protein